MDNCYVFKELKSSCIVAFDDFFYFEKLLKLRFKLPKSCIKNEYMHIKFSVN